MKVDLKYVDNGDLSGWQIPGHAIDDPEGGGIMNGVLVAHDLVEHVNGWRNIGTVEDEMEACGGIWFCRGQYGDISRDGSGSMHTPEHHVSVEIANNLRYITNRRLDVIYTEAGDAEDALQEIWQDGWKGVRSEILDESDWLDAEQKANVRFNYQQVIHWMRSGYRKAAKRYGSGMSANRLFWNIHDTIEGYKWAEEWNEYELQYCIKSGAVSLREKEYNEEYDRFE